MEMLYRTKHFENVNIREKVVSIRANKEPYINNKKEVNKSWV